MDNNIYLIPDSFPCEKCNQKVEVKFTEDLQLICFYCKTIQRKEYYGRWFGIIKNVK